MEKLMTLDVLSSIKGAESSKAVEKLFETIKNAHVEGEDSAEQDVSHMVVQWDELRADEAIPAPKEEVEQIVNNFPKSKNGYLMVSKVID